MSKSKLFIFTAVTAVSMSVVRLIQMVLLTDYNTGFFKGNFEGVAHLLTVLIVVAAAVCALFGIYLKTDEICFIPKNSFYFGCVNLLIGFSQIAELFSFGISLEALPTVITVLRTVSIFASGFAFCYFGFSYITKNKVNYYYICLPVIAWIFRLIATFITFSGMSNISDNLYDILMLASNLVFLLHHGKLLCGIGNSASAKIMFSSAVLSVVTSSITILPRLLTAILNLEAFPHRHIDSPITAFFMLLYVISYLCNICYCSKEKNQ